MTTVLRLHRPEDAALVAASLLASCPESRVFTFNGPMGAGKTTLIKALCTQLGVGAGMSSPTFSIVNEYRSRAGETLYHFDLYRLEKVEELDGIGFGEYIDSGCYCFVEWPDLAEALLPPGTVHTTLHVAPDGTRELRATIHSTHPLSA